MVKCPKCGYENREGLKVCLNCGYNLPETSEASESPKEVKKEVSTEKPKKSGHGFLKMIIVLVFIFLVLIVGAKLAVSSLSDSPYVVDFDGHFTIGTNENITLYRYSGGSTCEYYWIYNGNGYTDNPELTIYYWLADNVYDLSMLDEFTEPEIDGNLRVYANNNIDYDNPQYDDYLVVVSNEEKVVGFMGSDLNALKDYANSVKF